MFFALSSITDLQWGKCSFLIRPFREGRLQHSLVHIFFDICQNRYMMPLDESREKLKGQNAWQGCLMIDKKGWSSYILALISRVKWSLSG